MSKLIIGLIFGFIGGFTYGSYQLVEAPTGFSVKVMKIIKGLMELI
jgi:hypothetical protein